MKQSEIDFCEWWRSAETPTVGAYNEHRKPYGDYWEPVWSGLMVADRPSMEGPARLGDRGADLLASYEAALALGLPIVADDHRCANLLDAARRCGPNIHDAEACPDCDLGRIPVPGLSSLVAVDPEAEVVMTMTCPTCSGTQVVPQVPSLPRPKAFGTFRHAPAGPPVIVNECGAIERGPIGEQTIVHGGGELGRLIAEGFAPVEQTDGWQALTPELAATLKGEEIEWRLHGSTFKTPPRTIAGTVIRNALQIRCGMLAFEVRYEVRLVNPWVTEPKAMREMLREAETSRKQVEIRWPEPGLGMKRSIEHVASVDSDWTVGFTTRHPGWLCIRPSEDWAFPVLTAVRRVVP